MKYLNRIGAAPGKKNSHCSAKEEYDESLESEVDGKRLTISDRGKEYFSNCVENVIMETDTTTGKSLSEVHGSIVDSQRKGWRKMLARRGAIRN